MSSGFEIILLLAVAVILLVRLIGVLGRRDGFEPDNQPVSRPKPDQEASVIDAQEDFDIEQFGTEESMKSALADAKAVEPSFRVNEFLQGSKAAYEMILMSFLRGDMSEVEPFVDAQVLEGFQSAIATREGEGQSIEANFVGIRDVQLRDAEFDPQTQELVLSVDYTAELTRVITDAKGKVLQGSKDKIETEFDHWQFARIMGSDDPNWSLVATG